MHLHLLRARLLIVAVAALVPGLYAVSAGGAQSSTTYTTLLRVAFVSPTRGVGLFLTSRAAASGRGPGGCKLYTRPTDDGGSSFGAPGAPIWHGACGSNIPFTQIRFDQAGALFAYGPGLRISTNEGRTWSSPRISGAVAALSTVGKSAWALTTHCRPGLASCTLTLLGTNGRDAIWAPAQPQPPDRTVGSYVALDGEVGTESLLTQTSQGAPVLALPDQPRKPEQSPPGTATVEQAAVGDAGWVQTKAGCATAFTSELSIAPDGSAWLACAGEPGVGSQLKSASLALQGLEGWKVVSPACTGLLTCHEPMPISGYLGGLFALSSSTAFYVGDRSALVGTTDGGRTWRTWPATGGQDAGTVQVTFVSPRYGWALTAGSYTRSSLWRTSDGGATWSRA